jgi:hypothetical protein
MHIDSCGDAVGKIRHKKEADEGRRDSGRQRDEVNGGEK